LLISVPARAQAAGAPELAMASPFNVTVERDGQAVSCPDLNWFEAHIAAHAGKAGHAGHFKIALSKRSDVWQASIRGSEQSGSARSAERILEDRSPTCEPLAEAVALTIAILAEDTATHTEPESPDQARPDASDEPPSLVVETPKMLDENPRSTVWVGAGGGVAMSFIAPVAPLLGFGVSLDSAKLSAGLRAMLTTEQKFELAPGHVVVQAWLGTLFSCMRTAGSHFGAALCGTFDLALLRASAEGFDDGQPSRRHYGAAGLELHPSWYATGSYRISAALGLLLPFTRESFSVIGRGVAYMPPALNWRVLVFSEIGAF
jgi:hypothetical protein